MKKSHPKLVILKNPRDNKQMFNSNTSFNVNLNAIKIVKEKGKFGSNAFEKSGIRLVSSEKKNGALVRLGVRPQHLKIDDRGPIEGKVTMIERLGTETVVELISPEKKPFRFVSGDTLGIKVSESVRFNFDPQLAHLF